MSNQGEKNTTSSFNMSRRDVMKLGLASVAAAGLTKIPMVKAGTGPLGFCPTSGLPGDMVRLTGADLGMDVANVAVNIFDGGFQYAHVRPNGFDSGELVTTIQAARNQMHSGHFEAIVGEGYHYMPNNLPPQLSLVSPIWAWRGNGGDRCRSFQEFHFPFITNRINCLSFWGNGGNTLQCYFRVPYDEFCCPSLPMNSEMKIQLYGTSANNVEEIAFDAHFVLTTSLNLQEIADAICAMIVSAFQTDLGGGITCNFFDGGFDNGKFINVSAGSPFVNGSIHIEFQIPGAGSMGGDSINGTSMTCDSMLSDCSSISPSCPSAAVDFSPIIFS